MAHSDDIREMILAGLDFGASDRDITQALRGVQIVDVQKLRRELGIPEPSASTDLLPADLKREIIEAFRETPSIARVAKEFEVDHSVVLGIVNKAGLFRDNPISAVLDHGCDRPNFLLTNREKSHNFLMRHIVFVELEDQDETGRWVPMPGFWIATSSKEDERLGWEKCTARVSQAYKMLEETFTRAGIALSPKDHPPVDTDGITVHLADTSQFAAALKAIGFDKERVQEPVLKAYAEVEKNFKNASRPDFTRLKYHGEQVATI